MRGTARAERAGRPDAPSVDSRGGGPEPLRYPPRLRPMNIGLPFSDAVRIQLSREQHPYASIGAGTLETEAPRSSNSCLGDNALSRTVDAHLARSEKSTSNLPRLISTTQWYSGNENNRPNCKEQWQLSIPLHKKPLGWRLFGVCSNNSFSGVRTHRLNYL
ncbi:uncharacterized protein LY79DRAFT_678580 [Colletotrichum navitas]|uniref:Uncharacterized protein n=1 Tax=Colletotrichum navitas TaxID=681940 RepID=A0AAD8UZN1_9PEZI|nr:uncharacterized protein LY79DRAFT_678580 [Colletotrichum navitas]KAK1569959.1 hypothetical protein LY79DRAFT_678580 [Colletotrichum navitas]